MTAARAGLAAVAVLVIAWLAVMERDLRLQQAGVEALRPGASPAQLDAAEGDLRGARFLYPDPAPDISLALVHRARGDEARALAAIEDVVRREPANLTAWATLGLLGGEAARPRLDAALRRLDPLNAR